MSLLIVSLDNTALNVALPAMRRDLGASVSGMQWTIDAYTLVLASLLMLAGSTADRIGRRKVFVTGLVVFALGSLLCSLAPSLEALVAFRAVQAVGGSMLNPVAMSIITNTFTEPAARARAIGVWGGVVGVSMAAGPLVGGLLVESVGWRAIFWVNLPVALAALLLTLRYVPESRAPGPGAPTPSGSSWWRRSSPPSRTRSSSPTRSSPGSRPWRSPDCCGTSRGAAIPSSTCASSTARRSAGRP